MGQTCTRYFMNKMSGRKRKNRIIHFMDGDETIEGDGNLLAHATDFYKTLFGHSDIAPVRMGFDFPSMVGDEDNDSLVKIFFL